MTLHKTQETEKQDCTSQSMEYGTPKSRNACLKCLMPMKCLMPCLPSLGLFETFCSNLIFYGELVGPRPIPKALGPTFVAVHDYLFIMFAVILHSWRPSPSFETRGRAMMRWLPNYHGWCYYPKIKGGAWSKLMKVCLKVREGMLYKLVLPL
jgi:hypothetical protein